MSTEPILPVAGSPLGLDRETLVRGFRTMLLSRRIDDREILLKRQNRLFFQISGAGHEAVQTALAFLLRPGSDWVFPYYRDRALCLGLGMTPFEMFLDGFGSSEGPSSSGRQMPSHWGSSPLRIFTTSSPTGSQCLPGVGAAEAGRYLERKESQALRIGAAEVAEDEIVVVTIGDGSTSEGEFWEALSSATTLRLPVLFLVEDNGYAISTPVEVNTPGGSISKLVRSFPGLFVTEVDGCDFLASYDSLRQSVAFCRGRKGPALVHAHVIRPYSHSLSDDERHYRTGGERKRETEGDPLDRFAAWLLSEGGISQEDLDRLRADVDREIAIASEEAAARPLPTADSVLDHVYSSTADPTGPAFDSEEWPEASGDELTMVDLINRTLRDEMTRDSRVVIWGEDVADASRGAALSECRGKGGVFKATAGLQRRFGPERVFNSPLAEAGIVGRAIGWAVRGLKPVVEIQFFDYIWPAMQQIRDELANVRWRSGGSFSCPVVIRVATGGYLTGGGPYHSQSGEVTFTHIPGLRVVMPATATDAAGLLRTAIRSDDPVLFLEHKHLYRQTHNRGSHPGPEFQIPFGKARVVRAGSDATLVTYGATVYRSAVAARRLEEETGRRVEVIDLRSLAPYDWKSVEVSVKKTNRLLIVHEDWLTHGFGAEIAARAADELFSFLDAPVRRVAAKDVFCGYAPSLEDATLPQSEEIFAAIEGLLSW